MKYRFKYQCLTTSCSTIKYSERELKNYPLYCVGCQKKQEERALKPFLESEKKSSRAEEMHRARAKARVRRKAERGVRICLVCQKDFSNTSRHYNSKCCSDECQKRRFDGK
jgi:hypothetical protein